MTIRRAQALRKMQPGTMGGQSWAATPAATARKAPQPKPLLHTCPKLAYTLDTSTPVPGHPTYHIYGGYTCGLNAAKDTLFVGAVDTTTFFDAYIARVDFPSMTVVDFAPGPIQLNRCEAALDSSGYVHNLWIPAGDDRTWLSRWSPTGTEVYRILQGSGAFTSCAITYNPVDGVLYGYNDSINDGNVIKSWDRATGTRTTISLPAGCDPIPDSKVCVTADGAVWVLSFNAGSALLRRNPTTLTWAVYPIGSNVVGGLWNYSDDSSVVVLKNDGSTWLKVDQFGAVTAICTSGAPSDLVIASLVSDDFTVNLLQGISHYYAWQRSA